MAIKINTHWIKVALVTVPQYSSLQTLPIVKTQKKKKNHNNVKTKIDNIRDEVILSGR